jgi:hypothetical protein
MEFPRVWVIGLPPQVKKLSPSHSFRGAVQAGANLPAGIELSTTLKSSDTD